jgi:hypothetical protein
VVTGEQSAVIDGFTITGGNDDGGGLSYADDGMLIANCVFSDNHAGYDGGAMTVHGDGVIVDSCAFIGNTSEYEAGAIAASSSTLLVVNSIFIDNYADYEGGAISNSTSTIEIVNCSFYANVAAYEGGALATHWSAPYTVANSIFWDNSPDQMEEDFTVTYSDVQGGYTGAGNIDGDPLFVDADAGDLSLQVGSPCIDAADGPTAPDIDYVDGLRVDDPDSANTGIGPPWADIGAYEYQP